jgi:hypothetical protein
MRRFQTVGQDGSTKLVNTITYLKPESVRGYTTYTWEYRVGKDAEAI